MDRGARRGWRDLLSVASNLGLGILAFSPLAQGMLTERYLDGIPADSRAGRSGPLRREYLSAHNIDHVRRLAARRGQSLARCAVTWVLQDSRVTSVVVGARTIEQLDDLIAAVDGPPLTATELAEVEAVPADTGVNLWGSRSSDL